MAQILADGAYDAVVAKYSVGPRKGGQLTMYFQLQVQEISLVGNIYVEGNDGVVSPAKLNQAKETFPKFDGTIESMLMPENFEGTEVTIVVRNEEYTNESGKSGVYTKVEWINPRGKVAGGKDLPAMADKSAMLAKYGSTFRALSPQPVKPAAKPPAQKKKAEGPVPTMEECYAKLQELNSTMTEQEQQDLWLKIVTVPYDELDKNEGWRGIMEVIEGKVLPF